MRTDLQDMGSSNGSFVNNIRQVLYSINNNNNNNRELQYVNKKSVNLELGRHEKQVFTNRDVLV
jgi:hypothetical protein